MANISNMLVNIITLIVGLSGWAVFLYERFTENPRIKGKILNVFIGQYPMNGKVFTSFLVCLYITNQHRNFIHIMDYELEADFGKGFQKLERAYGVENIHNIKFLDTEGNEIIIPNLNKELIYKKHEAVKFGEILTGYVLFLGKKQLHKIKIKKYKITCLDAFDKRHQFTSTPKQFVNFNLFLEMTGIKFPSKNSQIEQL